MIGRQIHEARTCGEVKILAGLVGGTLVLRVAAPVAVWLLVNPNDYKGRIAEAVENPPAAICYCRAISSYRYSRGWP